MHVLYTIDTCCVGNGSSNSGIGNKTTDPFGRTKTQTEKKERLGRL
jgi:hypothetical protein